MLCSWQLQRIIFFGWMLFFSGISFQLNEIVFLQSWNCLWEFCPPPNKKEDLTEVFSFRSLRTEIEYFYFFSPVAVPAPLLLHQVPRVSPDSQARHFFFLSFLPGEAVFLCWPPSPSAGSWGAIPACCGMGMQSLSSGQSLSQQTAFHPGDLHQSIQWATIKMNRAVPL